MPRSQCFGCGPQAERGLGLECYVEGDAVVATWQPRSEHQGAPGSVNAGIIATLFDCQGAWTAIERFMRRKGVDEFVPMKTRSFHVELVGSTPIDDHPVEVRSTVTDVDGPRAVVEATVTAHGQVTARFRGVYEDVTPPG